MYVFTHSVLLYVGFNFNICCVGWTRTTDLQVMSLTSYHCYYHAILCGDDETRTRVLQRTNNTSISHVYSIIHNWKIGKFLYFISINILTRFWVQLVSTQFHILFKVPRCVREGLGSYCVISTNERHYIIKGHSWHFVIYCFVHSLKSYSTYLYVWYYYLHCNQFHSIPINFNELINCCLIYSNIR